MPNDGAAFGDDAFEQQHQGKRTQAQEPQRTEIVQIRQQVGLLKQLLMDERKGAAVGLGVSQVFSQHDLARLNRVLKSRIVWCGMRHQRRLVSLGAA